jgi:uncharacterized protein (TIGR03067 family)
MVSDCLVRVSTLLLITLCKASTVTEAPMRCFLLVSCFCFLSADREPPAKEKSDQEKMQGEWTMSALDIREKYVPTKQLEGTVLTIKDDKYTVKTKTVETTVTFKLDPKQDPKHIDMFFPDGKNEPKCGKGIYKFEGEKLIICRSQSLDGDRPRNFASSLKNDDFVVTWEPKAK